MTNLICLSSSLRTRSPSETLELARGISHDVGITRVVDTTWLDKIGVPVFSSVRPRAQNNSLCVNAGKGLRPLEAKVGAYMEAIEFALAEYNEERDRHRTVTMTPRELNELYAPDFKFVDFCPIYNRNIDPDEPLYALEAMEMMSSAMSYIPAELVFHPLNKNDLAVIFGTSTNGLSSGNTLQEAVIHGVFEVMERDIQSFDFIDDMSYLVSQDSYPPDAQELLDKCKGAGLDLQIRYTPNRYGIAYIMAFLIEPSLEDPIAIATGYGAHVNGSIAAVRAISEAIQSRLSYIHGGRDDLIHRYDYFEGRDRDVELEALKALRAKAYNRDRLCDFSDVPCLTELSSIELVTEFINDALKANGISKYFVYNLSRNGDQLHVCKVVIPTMEGYQPHQKVCVGPRLRRAVLEKVKRNNG